MSYSADVEKTTSVLHGNEKNHIYIYIYLYAHNIFLPAKNRYKVIRII